MTRRGRRRTSKGAQLLEFTRNLLPFLAMLLVLFDTAWAVYAKATIQQAVRMAVRDGVTLTTNSVTGNLTDTVKGIVQLHAVGFLNGTTGKSYIKVHYYDQNNPGTDVSNQTWGNTSGNIMKVSVEGYPLVPLMPRIFNWGTKADNNPLVMTVFAADIIEPMASNLTPPIGPAP